MDVGQIAKEGLGWAVSVILGGVIVYQNKRMENLYKEKDGIQDQRREDVLGLLNKYNESMGDFSQTAKLLLAKLSAGDKS